MSMPLTFTTLGPVLLHIYDFDFWAAIYLPDVMRYETDTPCIIALPATDAEAEVESLHQMCLNYGFKNWLNDRWQEPGDRNDSPLQTLYAIDGRTDLRETILDHLEGYCGSRPVRVGNAASHQLQLDIYGELMDAAYLHNKHAEP